MKSLRIYFASAMGRGREGNSLHDGLISLLDPRYGTVTRERVSGPIPTRCIVDEDAPKRLITDEELFAWRRLTPAAKREDELRLLRSCHFMVAEITLPSIQLGILIAEADLYRIPTLCVRQRSLSVSLGDIPLISGNNDIVCAEYDKPEDLLPVMREFFYHEKTSGLMG